MKIRPEDMLSLIGRYETDAAWQAAIHTWAQYQRFHSWVLASSIVSELHNQNPEIEDWRFGEVLRHLERVGLIKFTGRNRQRVLWKVVHMNLARRIIRFSIELKQRKTNSGAAPAS